MSIDGELNLIDLLKMEAKKKFDIPNLNKEAKLNAIKHICNVLQRPHQLEKVDQHKKRILRKNVSDLLKFLNSIFKTKTILFKRHPLKAC